MLLVCENRTSIIRCCTQHHVLVVLAFQFGFHLKKKRYRNYVSVGNRGIGAGWVALSPNFNRRVRTTINKCTQIPTFLYSNCMRDCYLSKSVSYYAIVPTFFFQSFSLPVASVFERVEDESLVMCLHLFSRWPCFYLFPAFSGRWVQSQLPSLDSECMLLVAQLLHSSLCTCLRGSDAFFGRSLLVPSDKRRSVHNSFGILSRIMITQFCTHFECAILDAF